MAALRPLSVPHVLRVTLSKHVASPCRRSHTFALRPFGPEVAAELAGRGFAVFDSALSAKDSAALREEIDLLADEGALQSNATHLVSSSGTTVQLRKRGVFEAEVHTLKPELRSRIPHLAAVEDDPTIRALLNVYHPKFTLLEQALKAQRSIGAGACFPIHVDSAAAVDNRVVTALLYLNPEWECERHGGALRIYPFPHTHVDIAPVEGRLVLISGTQLLHRVLPANKTRYALTLWLSGTYRSQPDVAFTTDAYEDEDSSICAALLSRKFRELTARVALAEEWDLSLREAHGPAEAAAAVEQHNKDRETIIARLPGRISSILSSDSMGGEKIENRVKELFGEPEELLKLLRKYEGRCDGKWL